MDERLKNIMDNLESRQIGLDETFKFHCTMCGKCCIHREDILLNPKDIYNMSQELKISTEELFQKYCEAYIGTDSKVPIVRIQSKGHVMRCPLMKVWSIKPPKGPLLSSFPLFSPFSHPQNTTLSKSIPTLIPLFFPFENTGFLKIFPILF